MSAWCCSCIKGKNVTALEGSLAVKLQDIGKVYPNTAYSCVLSTEGELV